MNELAIRNAIQAVFNGALVRARETDGGWLIEVIHQQCRALGTSAFRRQIEGILASISNSNPPLVIWKLFVYPDESSRYLSQGTLHCIPSDINDQGIKTTTLAGMDAYLDIPEFDAELISFSNYRGHVIPALESLSATGNPILPVQALPVQYLWLEAMGGEYSVQAVNQNGNLNGRNRYNVILP